MYHCSMICLHHFVPFLIVLPENSSKTFICITKLSLSPLQVGLVIPFLPLAMVVVHCFTKSKVKFIIKSVLSFPKMMFSPCSVSYMSMITTMPYIIEHKTIPSMTLALWPRFKPSWNDAIRSWLFISKHSIYLTVLRARISHPIGLPQM